MKTELDPQFEYKENKEFRKEFFTGLAITIALAFIIAIILIVIAFGDLIDGITHDTVMVSVLCCLVVIWFLNYIRKQLDDFKHNDQR